MINEVRKAISRNISENYMIYRGYIQSDSIAETIQEILNDEQDVIGEFVDEDPETNIRLVSDMIVKMISVKYLNDMTRNAIQDLYREYRMGR